MAGLRLKLSERFDRDYGRLPPDLQKAVDECLEDLAKDPIPNARRSHSVTPRGQRPIIYTLDVTPNKAWKLSYLVKGNVAHLLRVDTHKTLNLDPGRKIARAVLSDR